MRNSRQFSLDRHNYSKLTKFLDNNRQETLVALFDIGTKACRVILAPKNVPDAVYLEWNRDIFFNASVYSKLGEDVDPLDNKLNPKSSKFWSVIQFVQFFRNYLVKREVVDADDIHAYGTEVFRWLENQEEILDLFYKHTSVKLRVLSEDEESFFSLIALQYTVSFTNFDGGNHIDSKEYDSIFLIDQGGGSTETSYFKTNNPDQYEHTSIGKLGTIALKDIFFRLDKQSNYIDPLVCNYTIPEQIEIIDDYISKSINNSPLFETSANDRKIFYGMGSALTNLFKMSNINIHNKYVSLETIDDTIRSIALKLNDKYQRSSDLYIKVEKGLLKDSEERELTLFYGLPVYAHILRKFKVEHILVAGFGLRYGLYVYMYSHNRSSLAQKEMNGIPVLHQKNQEEVSITREDVQEDFIQKMKEAYQEQFHQLAELEKLYMDYDDESTKQKYDSRIKGVESNIARLNKKYLNGLSANHSGEPGEQPDMSIKELKSFLEEKLGPIETAIEKIHINVDLVVNELNTLDLESDIEQKKKADQLLEDVKSLLEQHASNEKEREVLNSFNQELSTSSMLKLTIPIIPGLLKYESDLLQFSTKETIKSWKQFARSFLK